MRFPPIPPPFTDRITCVGTLSAEDRTTSPLDVLVDVSKTGAHGMRGWVLGNTTVGKDIERALGRHRGSMRLKASTGSETVTSEGIWIRETQSFGADRGKMPHGLHGIACAFDCFDLTRRFEVLEERTKEPREVRFLTRGPHVRGLVSWMRRYSFEGTNTVEVFGGRPIATGGGLGFSMFALPHFLYDQVGGQRTSEDDEAFVADVTSQTHALAIVCRTRRTPDAYGDNAFLADAKEAIGDMCLLLSLLAGGMITWYAYSQSGSGVLLRFDRSLSVGTVAARQEEIVQTSELREFLRVAFRRLRRLRMNGIDLEMPIVSAIVGAQARVARQRFGEFFLALEALHSIERERRNETFLIADKTFRRVRGRLKEPLMAALRAEGVRSHLVVEQMTLKLTELNRPALWDGLRELLARLRVDWEDLYPEPAPERPTFVKLRNTLFHSHARADDHTIHKEAVRVEAVVHRILLRWLGWESLWNAPPPEMRHYVSGKALPDRHRLNGRRRERKRGQ